MKSGINVITKPRCRSCNTCGFWVAKSHDPKPWVDCPNGCDESDKFDPIQDFIDKRMIQGMQWHCDNDPGLVRSDGRVR